MSRPGTCSADWSRRALDTGKNFSRTHERWILIQSAFHVSSSWMKRHLSWVKLTTVRKIHISSLLVLFCWKYQLIQSRNLLPMEYFYWPRLYNQNSILRSKILGLFSFQILFWGTGFLGALNLVESISWCYPYRIINDGPTARKK